MARTYTNQLLDLVEAGAIDPLFALNAALSYMSEQDVQDMMYANGMPVEEECKYCGGNCENDIEHACDGFLGDVDNLYDDRRDVDEYDGQPDEAQEWHDFDPEC